MKPSFILSGLLLVICLITNLHPVAAGQVQFVSGAGLRGLVQNISNDKTPEVSVVTASGLKLSFDKADIASQSESSTAQDEYYIRNRLAEQTVDSQWELAEWCRKNGMTRQRSVHLQNVLALDPTHTQAHYGLGHVHQKGKWIDRDLMMQAMGYVKYKGKFISPEEYELIQENEITDLQEKAWYPKVRLWVGWLTTQNPGRVLDGQKNLTAITDTHAIRAMAHFMGTHTNIDVRRLYIDILNGITNDQSTQKLVMMAVLDIDSLVRSHAIGYLTGERIPYAVQLTIPYLQNANNPVVRKAAYLLSQIGDKSAVPYLIDALVTTHRYQVQVEVPAVGVSSGPRSGLGNSYGVPLPPEIDLQLRTGQLPYGVSVTNFYDTPRPTRTVEVDVEQENYETHEALVQLTGVDFGYAEIQWKNWWFSQNLNKQ
jgi:hypothetical protein